MHKSEVRLLPGVLPSWLGYCLEYEGTRTTSSIDMNDFRSVQNLDLELISGPVSNPHTKVSAAQVCCPKMLAG